MLNVVIVHCHFERGGVTQVVRNHVQAMLRRDPTIRVTLLSGARVGDLDDEFLKVVRHEVVGSLDYDDRVAPSGWTATSVATLLDELLAALKSSQCSPEDTVIHWHNHSLGKNSPTPEIIGRLAKKGWRFLLQIHDFAEDYRPENLKRLMEYSRASTPMQLDGFLYPTASTIHYATLTSADHRVLTGLGIEADRRHTLPNSVVFSQNPGDRLDGDRRAESLQRVRNAFNLPSESRWSIYPVRGIRRKNVGELLLLSQLMPPNVYTGITLCPATPVERESYRRWQAIAERIAPRVIFDAGQHADVSFDDNLTASDFVVSTSVAEGFGMVFLEPWLAGRGVVARRIASATDDFVSAGMQLDRLYEAIWIPGDGSWLRKVENEFSRSLENALGGLPASILNTSRFESSAVASNDAIDFARLTPQRQSEILQRCVSDEGFMREVRDRALRVCQLFAAFSMTTISENQACIERSFSLEKQGGQLCELYQTILSETRSRVASPVHAGTALASVTDLHPYYPCRTELVN